MIALLINCRTVLHADVTFPNGTIVLPLEEANLAWTSMQFEVFYGYILWNYLTNIHDIVHNDLIVST